MPKRARVTTTDVARAAGVARSTVSYVLNPDPIHRISEATRERVLAAVRDLGYAPSAAARTLRRGRSDIVLGLVRDFPIAGAMGLFLQDLAERFADRGLTFVIHQIAAEPRPLERLWGAITPVAIVGFDVLSRYSAAELEAAGAPVVEILRDGPGTPIPESPTAAAQVALLLERGHRRIGVLTVADPRLGAFAIPRAEGAVRAVLAAGLPRPDVQALEDLVLDCERILRHWRDADDPVTAVCAYDDEVALALLAAARRLGIAVPDELAIIGVGDTPASRLSEPPLTTVRPELSRAAHGIVETVEHAIEEGQTVVAVISHVAAEPVVRGTT